MTEQTRADWLQHANDFGGLLTRDSGGNLLPELTLYISPKRIAGAGIDTFSREPIASDHPLLDAPNVIVSPHAAHYSQQSSSEIMLKAFGNVAAVLRGERPRYPVNFV